MTEQENREKVIKGLEYCINNERATPDCMRCPYAEIHGICTGLYKLHGDALALLKAQEPRVMTLEEVEEGKPYWLEMRRIASEYAICKLNDNGDSAFLDFAVQFGWKTLESDGYGKTWCCWTSRPTDEQRETVKWE